MLLNLNNGKLSDIKEIAFKTEKELQILCENNLNLLLNIDFVASEFVVTDLRLDSVAYDSESNAFVIIEYKNSKNSSVIDQGYSYLSTMFNHQADFVLEYNKVTGKSLGKNDIDWSQSRVVFISPSYTKYQINSINFKDLPIELWKIKQFANGTVLFEEVKPAGTTATIKEIAPVLETSNVVKTKESTKVYTEEDLITGANEEIVDLYFELKDYIVELDDSIKTKFNKLYVAFIFKNKIFASLKVQKNSIIIWIYANIKDIDDSFGLVEDVSEKGHHGCGNCQIKISDKDHIGAVQDILRKNLESKK